MKNLTILLWLVGSLFLGVAQARECQGVSFPDELRRDETVLTLNGLGVRKATFLKVKVYVAALYVPKASTDAEALLQASEPAELILHFVRDVSAGDLRKAWSEGFARNSQGQLGALQARIVQLNGWMSDVRSGQRLTFVRRPGVGTDVAIDGTPKGTIEGDDFARALLAIWLGATPPNPEIKKGLLGQPCE